MLTERERVALERYRSREFHYADVECDRQALALAMLRLYPPGWNEPVTPERLVELGGKVPEWPIKAVEFDTCTFWFSGDILQAVGCYNVAFDKPLKLMGHLVPRNMQEARQLLERCGAIKEAK